MRAEIMVCTQSTQPASLGSSERLERLQSIPCNACGADSFQEIALVGEWHVGKCTNCSLLYVNPMPFFRTAATEFADLSRDLYYTKGMYKISSDKIQAEMDQLRRQSEQATRYTGRKFESPRFLDVGCGSGMGVRAALELGWLAIGIDIDHDLIRIGQRELNVDVRCSNLMESHFQPNWFHFVRLRHVLEHLPNPYDVMVEVKRILAPGGVGLIVAPNESGLSNQLRLFWGGRKNQRYGTLRPPHHLHAFTPSTLKLLLERVGFEKCLVKTTTPSDPIVRVVLSKNTGSPSLRRALYTSLLLGARTMGRGSLLVGWIAKDKASFAHD
jgi:SAM-dependent methyltransferase